MHLLLLARLLPAARTERDLLTLPNHAAHLTLELDGRPQEFDIGILQVPVILVE